MPCVPTRNFMNGFTFKSFFLIFQFESFCQTPNPIKVLMCVIVIFQTSLHWNFSSFCSDRTVPFWAFLSPLCNFGKSRKGNFGNTSLPVLPILIFNFKQPYYQIPWILRKAGRGVVWWRTRATCPKLGYCYQKRTLSKISPLFKILMVWKISSLVYK